MSSRRARERRRRDRDHVEPVVQVLPEAPRLDLGQQVVVGGGHDARVGPDRVTAHRLVLALLQHAQELHLNGRAELADLVEEQRAATRAARSGPLARATAPVKAPRSCPKSSASRMLSGMAAQLTATNGPPARALLPWMKRARSSLPVPLSPSTSTVALEGAACVATSSTRRSAGLCPTISRVVRSLSSCLSERFSHEQRLPLGRLAHALDDRHALERLLDEVVGALAHRLHGGLDRAVGGHHHELGVGRDLLQRAQQLERRSCPASSGRSAPPAPGACARPPSAALRALRR